MTRVLIFLALLVDGAAMSFLAGCSKTPAPEPAVAAPPPPAPAPTVPPPAPPVRG